MDRVTFCALAAVALAFVVTRSLSSEPVYFLALDDPVYLGLAAHLPHYSLYAAEGFVNHPPLFPVLIRLTSLVCSPPVAGLAVATGMQALGGIFLWQFAQRGGLGRLSSVTMLALLVLSTQWHRLAGMTYKETTYVTCVLGMLSAWVAAADGQRRALAWATVAAGATVVTSDHSVFAVAGTQGAVVLYALAVGRWRWRLVIPAIGGALCFAVWLGWRLHVYRSAPEVAVGLGGMLEPTGHVGLRQLLTPQALPHSAALTGVRTSWPTLSAVRAIIENLFSLAPLAWAYRAGLAVPPLPVLPGTLLAGIGAVWLLFQAFAASDARRRGLARAVLVLGVVLLIPASQEIVRARLRMFLALPALIAIGTAGAFASVARRASLPRYLAAIGIGCGMLGTCAFAGRTLPHVTWFRPSQIEAQPAIDWLNTRPVTSIMTQLGYSPELAWKTPHRVFGLPTDPASLERQVREHSITLLVYGTHYWQAPDGPGDRPVWNGDTIRQIRAAPDRYPLVATLREVYVPPLRGLAGDTLWIHAVAVPAPQAAVQALPD